MDLINGLNVFLLLSLFSLFYSANAVCVPRNSSEFLDSAPVNAPTIAPAQTPPQAPAQAPPQAPAEAPPQAPDQSPSPATNSGLAPTASNEEEALGLASDGSDSNFMSSVEAVVSSGTNDLAKICGVTDDPTLCKNSISSVEGSTVDPTTALKTEIEQSIKEVEKAVATVKTLRQANTASKLEIACYDTCLENFDMAIFDLKSGLESIDTKDTGKMESVLTAVLTDLMTCDDTFIEMGVNSPLDNLSAKMDKYANNCLALSKLLL